MMTLSAPINKFLTNFKVKNLPKILCGYSPTAKCSSWSNEKSYNGSVLQKTNEDLSTVTPYFSKTFNIAAYVNSSQTLQNLVQLNVNLNKIERKPYVVEKILKLDFERHMKSHILFLNDHIGVEEVGDFITKNPLILCESLENLQVRVNYLQSKGFSNQQIKRIISKNPFWLMFSTVRIDRRFGYFQKCLDLHGIEVRQITCKKPQLITYNLNHVKTNMFVIKEEMGFEEDEMKKIVMENPKILMISQKSLLERFNYIHNTMKIPHTVIMENLGVLFCRNFKIKQRHLFLDKLGRSQYNPKKENYVPLLSLVADNDAEFCKKIAKCTVSDFNLFLKTL